MFRALLFSFLTFVMTAFPHGSTTASTLTLGSPIDEGSCSKQGDSDDRSCGRDATVETESDTAASLTITAHAAADASQDLLNKYRAKATNQIRFVFPYSVTRTIKVEEQNGQLVQIVPQQQLLFEFDYDFRAIVRNEVGSGDEKAVFDQATIEIGETSVDLGNMTVANSNTLAQDRLTENRSLDMALPVGESVGEVSFITDIPTDYGLWDDVLAPNLDYRSMNMFEQTYTGSFVVSFRMVADSYDSVNIGGNGGEAFVCGGQASDLSSFLIDDIGGLRGCDIEYYTPPCDIEDPLNCNPLDFYTDPTGFMGDITLIETGTVTRPFTAAPVPLPAAVWMFTAGLGLLFGLSSRRQLS